MVYFTEVLSPLGQLLLYSDGTALTGLYLPTQTAPDTTGIPADLPVFRKAAQWLDGYFSGQAGPVDFPLAPSGTAFQQRVWQLLLTVPRGHTVTYGQLAARLSPTMSAQAVGGAVGKNPIAIIIPCHRCIGAGGKLTGYAGGLEIKQWLLRHEEVIP